MNAANCRFAMLFLSTALGAFAIEALPARPVMTPDLPPPEATEVWTPVPPVVTAPADAPPSDAIVLFDGRNLDAWESVKTLDAPAPWKIQDGAAIVVPKSGGIRTRARFGDLQLHIEWRAPAEVKGSGQSRGNSGVFFMGLYELQVLDSYENKTYVNGQAGAIYKQIVPLVNAARKPGEWQVYDAVWIAPRFAADGELLRPARVTVFHNGVLVQHDVAVKGPTVFRGTPRYFAHASKLPLELQEHGSAVAFRNVWVRELTLPGE
jgi:hypothetical protein